MSNEDREFTATPFGNRSGAKKGAVMRHEADAHCLDVRTNASTIGQCMSPGRTKE